jgi:uncharacterized protein YbjT (DUF2867 family)
VTAVPTPDGTETDMTPPILVTGGTGTLGRLVVARLRGAGHGVRVLSRGQREPLDGVEHVTADLRTGAGVAPAVAGAEVVVHLAGGPKGDDAATRTLVRAAAAAGVGHLVCISVIGADRVPLGYFRAKLGAERAVAESGLPSTVLRAAQFHDLVLTVARKMAALPVLPAPGGLRFEPVDARDVADRIAELALGAPAGAVPDLAGPAVRPLVELCRDYLAATGRRRPTLPVRIPGGAGKAYRAGENLAGDGARRGVRTWEDFLAERVGAAVG